MQITTTTLTRAAGLAAVVSGSLFIAVQVKHPEITLDFVTTTQWKIRQGMKVAMATLALAGVAGCTRDTCARWASSEWSAGCCSAWATS